MLKILGGLFAARQRGVEDGAAPPTVGMGVFKTSSPDTILLPAEVTVKRAGISP